jgi:CheY-like chemotaxis protein
MGYAEMLLEKYAADDRLRQDLTEIFNSAMRGKELTHQLLAFSRKQLLELNEIDLNGVISDLENMLRRLIREDIHIEYYLSQETAAIRADVNQIEQVIINLAVNAQDAMPNGGRLIIETSNEILDGAYLRKEREVDIVPGPYVLFSLTDTGSGIDDDKKEHIFDPFFTTKSKGKGTGLGLATVYGIVKQHNGYIWVYSEPDHGTTFKVYIPKAFGLESKKSETVDDTKTGQAAGETILIVEDDPAILELVQQMLQQHGYATIKTASPSECLEIATNFKHPIHLLLTDVVMPEMNGKEIYEKIREYYPNIKVLFMSGYTNDVIADRGILNRGTNLIEKPFSMKALLAKVREALDG